ncbi:TPA: hypothetical protein PPO51_002469 [Clostridioides difficile]|nr:hypothetical protein [Clostridioides difficile]
MKIIKDYSIKNTTKKQRRKLIDNSLGIISISPHKPSRIILELSNKYIEGKLEIKKIQDILLGFYNRKYLNSDEFINTLEDYILLLKEESENNGIATDEKGIKKIIDENIDTLKGLSE